MKPPGVRGGLRLESHKVRPLERPVSGLPAPATVVLALDQGSGRDADPVVRPGEAVGIGTLVAEARDGAAAVHSPVSGIVREIATRATTRGPASCVVIDNDGRDVRDPGCLPFDWRAASADALLDRIAAGGVAGLGGAAYPTAAKLRLARSAGVELLLLNGAECEPWICCDDALMRERAADVLLGAQVMLAACGAARCAIAVEDDKPEALAALAATVATANDERVDVRPLPAVFPLGAEGPLVSAVTGREVPQGGFPPDVGVVCQNVATAAAVARLMRDGLPLVRRVVTVTGSGVARPTNVEAVLGTPVADLIAACGGETTADRRLIAGGSLTGRAFGDAAAPVTKGLNCVLVATGEDVRQPVVEMPCIRCGDCADVCPAGLLPQQLHRAAQAGDSEGLARYGLEACIECGCCDYVCPSGIPLTARFSAARERERLRDRARDQALQWKTRYERHQHRLAEQAEAERQAFDAARRRARGDDRAER
jgi:electron transport complex protein RnfC